MLKPKVLDVVDMRAIFESAMKYAVPGMALDFTLPQSNDPTLIYEDQNTDASVAFFALGFSASANITLATYEAAQREKRAQGDSQ